MFFRQDNAGCYQSTSVLLSAQRRATKNNINLCQVDYSDPQGGKGPCDRKAATIKSHIKIYLNEGHDVETAEQMVQAIESGGGVPGVRVTLCDICRISFTLFRYKRSSGMSVSFWNGNPYKLIQKLLVLDKFYYGIIIS